MLAAGVSFVVMTALVKSMGSAMHPIQAAFLRYLLGTVFVLPALRPIISANLTARHWRLFGLRGMVHAVGVMLWFFAMTQIPLAEVTAMNYLTPIYVTLGAVFFLGEVMAGRRIAAIMVALLGALIILRPGFREVSAGHLAMLGTSLMLGASYLLAKVTVDELSAGIVLAQLSIWVTLALAPFAALVWTAPGLTDLGMLFLVALTATAGHYFMTLALKAAPVAVTQPVTFLQLVWSISIGWLIFAEPVDLWVVAGGTLILGAVSFITWREAVLKRRALTPVNIAPKLDGSV